MLTRARRSKALFVAVALANIVLGLAFAHKLEAKSVYSAMACTVGTDCHCMGTFCVLGGTAHDCTANNLPPCT